MDGEVREVLKLVVLQVEAPERDVFDLLALTDLLLKVIERVVQFFYLLFSRARCH